MVVTFNYRVGPYGFLWSRELEEASLARGEKGFANQGFHDQRLALKWVHSLHSDLSGTNNNDY